MAVFCVLLFVPIMMQHLVVKQSNLNFEKKNRNSLLFFFLLLTILVMFRHEGVGNDTTNYSRIFKTISNISWNNLNEYDIEVGFSFYTKFISLFVNDSRGFFVITALITSIMIYPTYRRLNLDPSLTIVIFCTTSTFFLMFSGIRQMMAIGIGFIAYEFTRNKKLVPFILCVLLAMTFHTSAFMLAVMYPIYHAKITKKWLYAVVPAVLLIFIFNKQIFSVFALFIERYTYYDTQMEQTGAYAMIVLFAAWAVFSFLIPDEGKLDKETIGLRNFLLLALVLQFFAPLHSLAMRMGYYYMIFIPLLIPRIIAKRSERWNQVAVIARHVMVVFFLFFFFITLGSDNNLNVSPYHFYWETV